MKDEYMFQNKTILTTGSSGFIGDNYEESFD